MGRKKIKKKRAGRKPKTQADHKFDDIFNCIFERNSRSGFVGQHTRICVECEAKATVHFYVPNACMNLCYPCAEKKMSGRNDAELHNKIFVLKDIKNSLTD